jgi:hypothetical protein
VKKQRNITHIAIMVITYNLLSMRCRGILAEENYEWDVGVKKSSSAPVEIVGMDKIHDGENESDDCDQQASRHDEGKKFLQYCDRPTRRIKYRSFEKGSIFRNILLNATFALRLCKIPGQSNGSGQITN